MKTEPQIWCDDCQNWHHPKLMCDVSDKPESDPVNSPDHYTAHPSGVECIEIVEHMNFNLGNAVKYISRADKKDKNVEDLKKARWYLDREISKLEGKPDPNQLDFLNKEGN